MPPRFATCPLCFQQFGSTSLAIHVPQCHQKQLKRWEQLPPRERGPKPQMPGMGVLDVPGKGGAGSASIGIRGVREARESRVAVPQHVQQFDSGPGNFACTQCRKCGRNFAADRVRYHESVCVAGKGPRKKFDSTKQRLSGIDDGLGWGGGGGGYKPRGAAGKGAPAGKAAFRAQFTGSSSAGAARSNWRREHEDFIRAIREAKRMDAEEKVRRPPPRSQINAPPPRQPRQAYASSALRNPEVMDTRQVRRVAAGYANASSRQRELEPSFPTAPQPVMRGGPGQRAAVSGPIRTSAPVAASTSRFAGGSGVGVGGGGGGGAGFGGGGKISISNSNVTSRGMLEAFGRI